MKRILGPKLHQFGFRRGHTTVDLLMNMSQRWVDALHARREVRAVALDISKAFDRVWHKGLLHKLATFGISGPLLAWLKSFLSGRTQRVVVNGTGSSFLPIRAGVPQGSVLAPLLFLVFINDLFECVQNPLDVFADDSTLWTLIRDSSVASRLAAANSLSADLAEIEKWAKRWPVTFNSSKTESLIISTNRDMKNFRENPQDKDGKLCFGPAACPHPHLVFCGRTLPESLSFKVVGLTFTCKLSWNMHIDNIAKAASRAISFLHRARSVLSRPQLSTIYKSHVRSRMEYCSPIWTGASATSLVKLDRIQARAAHMIGPSQAILLSSLAHRRSVAALCAMHRIVHGTAPAPLLPLCPTRAPTRRRTRASAAHPTVFVPPHIVATTATYWMRSFIPSMTVAWNALPSAVQSDKDIRSFKTSVNNLSLDHSLL